MNNFKVKRLDFIMAMDGELYNTNAWVVVRVNGFKTQYLRQGVVGELPFMYARRSTARDYLKDYLAINP